MNSLDDLRTTLRDHAHDLDGIDPVSRSVGIRTKVTEQRRRRNAVRGGVALAAVAAVVSGLVLTDLGSGPAPDPAADLGAPESFTALGWTYALADAVQSDGRTQTVSLPASERPYLISWMTDGDGQDVTVTAVTDSDTNSDADNSVWSSSAADWADHVVIPGGSAQAVTVSAAGNDVEGIAVATYEIDPSRIPVGKGSGQADAFHFREKVADRVLVDAAFAEGRGEIRFDYSVPDGTVALTHSCAGIPEGAWVRINLDGSDDSTKSSEGCLNDDFDPGAASSSILPTGRGKWPSEGTVRMWVSRSETDLTPIPASELTGTKLGVGLYSIPDRVEVWGTDVDRRLEFSGHTWEFVERATVDSGAPHLLDSFEGPDGEASPRLVKTAHDASSDDVVTLAVETDGNEVPGLALSSAGEGVAIMGTAVLPPWTRTVSMNVTEGADVSTRQALLLYRLVD